MNFFSYLSLVDHEMQEEFEKSKKFFQSWLINLENYSNSEKKLKELEGFLNEYLERVGTLTV